MKYLVYFVIGGDQKYVKLLQYCINTLRNYTENDVFDIMIMCDKNYIKYVNHLPVQHLHITGDNLTPDRVSTRKVEIFSFDKIKDYDKILYLDCDIVIAGNLAHIMEHVVDNDKLYVCSEKSGHNYDAIDNFCDFFSRQDKPYTEYDLQFFRENKIYPFNAGQFAFCQSETMKNHFEHIATEINSIYIREKFFYEQCFLNEYFNRRNATNNLLSQYCYLCHIVDAGVIDKKNIINHFLNCTVHFDDKFLYMQEFHKHFCQKPIQIDNRNQLHTVLNMPTKPVIAEIGVFRGEYAEYLLQYFDPDVLLLIDPWSDTTICSGDHNGNNVQFFNGSELYNHVLEKFKDNTNVVIVKNTSQDTDIIKQLSLDMIYIDGDHSYEGVKNDLALAMKWVKKGGWVCGHDYCMNFAKTSNNYDFGVKKAVDEFCYEHGYFIAYLAYDGCVSYAIRK
jgi:hypothetical protein